jgi:hypothetical protein
MAQQTYSLLGSFYELLGWKNVPEVQFFVKRGTLVNCTNSNIGPNIEYANIFA